MKKLLLIALLLSFAVTLKAQDVHHVELNFENSVGVQDFHVEDVIDGRFNKSFIGVVQKGMGNRQVNATFPEEFTRYLQNYFGRVIIKNRNSAPVTIKINNLTIAESTSAMSEMGIADVEIEILKKEGEEYFSFGKFSSRIEGKGADVTARHGDRLAEALNDVLKQFAASDWKSKAPVAAEEVQNDNTPAVITVPEKFKKGLYYTFNDVITNSPQDMEFDVKEMPSGKTKRYVVKENGKNKKIKNLFAFSDGENLYLNASRYTQGIYFVKSQLIGKYIYFEDVVMPPGAQAAGAAFGLAGGIAAAASAKNRGIILDTSTGITTVLVDKEMEKLLVNEPEHLKTYRASKKPEAIKLIIQKLNEKHKAQL